MAATKDPRYRAGQVNESGRQFCGAKNRRGQPCSQTIVCTNGRCRMHGGTTPRGMASPHYKHGKYAKYLPTRMLEQYQAAKSDPAILELGEQISVIDARIVDVMGRVDTGESGKVWRDLKELVSLAEDAFARQMAAQARDDKDGAEKENRDAMDLTAQAFRKVRQSHSDYAAWNEITDLILKRMRLVESERKRYKEMHQVITAERALIIFDRMADSIREHVLANVDGSVGRAILSGVQHDLGGILGQADARQTITAGD